MDKKRKFTTTIVSLLGLAFVILTASFCSQKKSQDNFQSQFYSDIIDSVHKRHRNKFPDSIVRFLFPKALRAIKFDTTNYRNTSFVFESWKGCRDWDFDIERFRRIKKEKFGIRTVSVCMDEYLRMHGVAYLESRLCQKQKCYPADNDKFELFLEMIDWLEIKFGYKRSWPTPLQVFWTMRTEEWYEVKEKMNHPRNSETIQPMDPIFESCALKDLENIEALRPDDDGCDRVICGFFCSKDGGERTNFWDIGQFWGYRWKIYKVMSDSLYCNRDTAGLLPITLAFDSTGTLKWAKSANGRYNSELSHWLQTLNGMHTIRFLNRKRLPFEFKVDRWLDVGHWGSVSERK